MQSIEQPWVDHSVESAGVDWITATAQRGSTRWEMSEYARHERERLMDSGESIKQSYRLGYDGWSAEGFFHGNREGSSIIIASGAVAHKVFPSVVNVSDHISRLDLQTTVATPHDRPHLGVQAYHAIKGGVPARVRVKNVTLIKSHPQGETVTLGKRTSDYYGRIYDKATEAQLGEARSLWRYEIEFKRRAAVLAAARLRGDPRSEAVARGIVFEYFNARGVAPIFAPDPLFCPQKPATAAPGRNVLTWFEESLSITVARAIHRHGLPRVLESLGLAKQVEVKRQ